MREIIVKGESRYVGQVERIISHLVRRGDIEIVPVNTAEVGLLIADDKYVNRHEHDSKTPKANVDEKKPRKPRATKK